MELLDVISRFIDRMNDRIGRTVSWLVLGMVVVTVCDTVLRYLFRSGSVAFQELEWHLFAINYLIAAGWTLKDDRHVRVDLFFSHFGNRTRSFVDLVGTILMCIPFSLLMIWSSCPFVLNSWGLGEGSPDPGGLPARYLLKSVIPIAFLLVALQGSSQCIKHLHFLLGCREEEQ